MVDYKIIPGLPDRALELARFCQPIYEAIYPNGKYGLKKEHFAPWIFETQRNLEYFKSVLVNDKNQCSYLAVVDAKIIGSISIIKENGSYKILCFYVGLNYQNRGVGKKLWRKAMEFCKAGLPILVEVAENNSKAINMYEKWGFTVRKDLGINLAHWPEWPEELENGYIFLEKTFNTNNHI